MEDKTVVLDDGAFLNFMLDIEKKAIEQAEKELAEEKETHNNNK